MIWNFNPQVAALLVSASLLCIDGIKHDIESHIYKKKQKTVPFFVYRSTSTVGFPRESNISRAWIFRMDMVQDLQRKHRQCGTGGAERPFIFASSLVDLKLQIKTMSRQKPEWNNE